MKVPQHEFLQAHADLLRRDESIIDGFGNAALAWEPFAVADTLIYVDLPLWIHYNWVTRRLIKGLFANPKGWPKIVHCGAARLAAIVSSRFVTVI